MTHKDLRHMGRRELIEIIYEMKKNEEELRSELTKAAALLKKRDIVKNEAGSIADAAVQLSGLFEAAQLAADDYVNSVKAASQRAQQIIDEAQRESEEILAKAHIKAEKAKASEHSNDYGATIILPDTAKSLEYTDHTLPVRDEDYDEDYDEEESYYDEVQEISDDAQHNEPSNDGKKKKLRDRLKDRKKKKSSEVFENNPDEEYEDKSTDKKKEKSKKKSEKKHSKKDKDK